METTAAVELTSRNHQSAKPALRSPAQISATVATIFAAAIFGFFYAWVCSTMWGLDNADPRIAIPAMQAMNESVRNFVFMPAFFFTPLVLAIAGLLALRERSKPSAYLLFAASVLYLVGGLGLTLLVNVPMNEELAQVTVPADRAEAAQIWQDYSSRWQVWNAVRTVVSGFALVLSVRVVAQLRT